MNDLEQIKEQLTLIQRQLDMMQLVVEEIYRWRGGAP
jgi:prefoldin subunit 5